MEALLGAEGTLLHELREHIIIVTEPLPSTLCSSALRALVAQVRHAHARSRHGVLAVQRLTRSPGLLSPSEFGPSFHEASQA